MNDNSETNWEDFYTEANIIEEEYEIHVPDPLLVIPQMTRISKLTSSSRHVSTI